MILCGVLVLESVIVIEVGRVIGIHELIVHRVISSDGEGMGLVHLSVTLISLLISRVLTVLVTCNGNTCNLANLVQGEVGCKEVIQRGSLIRLLWLLLLLLLLSSRSSLG